MSLLLFQLGCSERFNRCPSSLYEVSGFAGKSREDKTVILIASAPHAFHKRNLFEFGSTPRQSTVEVEN